MGDLAITPADVQRVTGVVRDGIAAVGATITAGQAVRENTSGQIALSSSQAGTSLDDAVGIALNDALPGQPVRYQTSGDITLGTGTEGVIYLLSANASGKIAPAADVTSPDLVTILGVGNDTNGIDMKLFVSGSQS